jgi:hypothetical protein
MCTLLSVDEEAGLGRYRQRLRTVNSTADYQAVTVLGRRESVETSIEVRRTVINELKIADR